MTAQPFSSRLNWRQLLMHFFACWFLIHAFVTFSYLYNVELFNAIRYSSLNKYLKSLPANEDFAANLSLFSIVTACTELAGIVIAFGISLAISIIRRWFWLNAIVALLLTLLLNKLSLSNWAHPQLFFWFIGGLFHNTTLELIINGALLLTISLLIFLLPQTNRFIEKTQWATAQ